MGPYGIGRVHGGYAQRRVVAHRLTRCTSEKKAVQLDFRSGSRPRMDGVQRPWQCGDFQMSSEGRGLCRGQKGGILRWMGSGRQLGEVRAKDRHRRRSPDDGWSQAGVAGNFVLAHNSARLCRGSGSTRRGRRRKSPKGTAIPAPWPAKPASPKLVSAVDRDKGRDRFART
jgi:hypothetical protein